MVVIVVVVVVVVVVPVEVAALELEASLVEASPDGLGLQAVSVHAQRSAWPATMETKSRATPLSSQLTRGHAMRDAWTQRARNGRDRGVRRRPRRREASVARPLADPRADRGDASVVVTRAMPISRRLVLRGLSCLGLGGCATAGPPLPGAVAMDPLVLRTPAPWKQGLGALEDVEPALQPAFTDAQGHQLLPPPGRFGWRRQRPEAPQSVADFRAEHPNLRVAPRDRLVLLPLGGFPFEVVADGLSVGLVRTPELPAIAELLAAFFATPVDTLPALPFPAARIARRVRDGRSQYDARDLLDRAARLLPANAYAMLALVNVDLFVFSDQSYAYGWSTLHNRLGVVGFSRLDAGPAAPFAAEDGAGALLRRGLRVVVHEVGHMFGLGHCQMFRCAMNGIADLEELDATPLRLCPLCLRKLHIVTDLDPRARDLALAQVFTGLGITDEARWLDERARRLWRTDPMLASGRP